MNKELNYSPDYIKAVSRFITENKDLINDNNFNELCKRVSEYNKNATEKDMVRQYILFEILLKSDIDFLSHMDRVVTGMFFMSDIEEIVIPKNIKVIGSFAFCGCMNLKSITFEKGSNLLEIDTSAFKGCDMLESISLPDGLLQLDSFAFCECWHIKTIELPNTLEPDRTGDSSMFHACIDLEVIKYRGTKDEVSDNENLLRAIAHIWSSRSSSKFKYIECTDGKLDRFDIEDVLKEYEDVE